MLHHLPQLERYFRSARAGGRADGVRRLARIGREPWVPTRIKPFQTIVIRG